MRMDLQDNRMSEETELAAAIDLLRDNLADQRWRNAVDIETAADALGLSVQSLARRDTGLVSKRGN
jgi:hypothetical protein